MKYRQRYASPAPYGELSYGAFIEGLLQSRQAIIGAPQPPLLLAPVTEASR